MLLKMAETCRRDAVRIKAMKCDGTPMPDIRKFSVDPRITSFDVLKSILGKAFDIKGDFAIYYRVLDDYGQETYLSLLSDWDLDAAFVSAAEPCLCLRVEIRIYEEVGQEWENTSIPFSWITESKIPVRLQGLIMNHVEKTVSMVRGALNFIEDVQQGQEMDQPQHQPLTDSEFRKFLDPVGQLIHVQEFRNTIYLGGVEPSLRKVVWKHLLNVYPDGLSGKQRIEYMKTKSYEYKQLRDSWKNLSAVEKMEDLAFVTNMVKKDVLRTDRHHKFYAGNDDNQNIVSLFNILTTYALNHPSVSYCQGMSDLASPLLVTMGDEAHAYICFCALMRRLYPNFLLDGVAMTQRFQHLADGLMYYDSTFYAYLKTHQADDLLFCYRWLLLEMKREFAFEDALRMLEVMWSSLPPAPASSDLPLYEVRFCSESIIPPPASPSPRETPYSKICALRRQTSSKTCFKINHSLDESLICKRRLRKAENVEKQFSSLDDSALSCNSSQKHVPNAMSNSLYSPRATRSIFEHSNPRFMRQGSLNLSKPSKMVKNFSEFWTLHRRIAKKSESVKEQSSSSSSESPDDSGEYYPMTTSMTKELSRELEDLEKKVFTAEVVDALEMKTEDVFVWENPLREETVTECNGYIGDSVRIIDDKNVPVCRNFELDKSELSSLISKRNKTLPPPWEFGGGNPFLMFLCIAVLCQHRDAIMNASMDYNEIAMHFDKMVRKHNVVKVLNQARSMYAAYLKRYKQTFLNV